MEINAEHFAESLPRSARVGRYWVAYSGGLDSSVLLSLLVQLRNGAAQFPPICAVHVHHGVSVNADSWVTHCSQVCDQLGVPIEIRHLTPKTEGANLENSLREARYEVFSKCVKKGEVMLFAHHLDDQLETVLLRLMRGSGTIGVAGMPRSRRLGEGTLLRPLLEIPRSQILTYAQNHELEWVEDDSNQNIRHDRNFLRHEVLTRVRTRWPSAATTVSRFAANIQQSQHALDYFLQPFLEEVLIDEGTLPIDALEMLPSAVQTELLRKLLSNMALPPLEQRHYAKIFEEVVAARADAQPLLQHGAIEFRRHRGNLVVRPVLPNHDPSLQHTWNPSEPIDLGGAGHLRASLSTATQDAPILRAPKSGYGLRIQYRKGGERCTPVDRCASRSLKKLLQEYGVPPWLRDRVPLLYREQSLVAVADIWVCKGWEAEIGEIGLALEWRRP